MRVRRIEREGEREPRDALELLVHLEDLAGNGEVDVGGGLDGLDGTEGLASGELSANLCQE